MSLVVRRL